MEMNKHHMTHAINEDTLEKVSGGINGDVIADINAPCEHFSCKSCHCGLADHKARNCMVPYDTCEACRHYGGAYGNANMHYCMYYYLQSRLNKK